MLSINPFWIFLMDIQCTFIIFHLLLRQFVIVDMIALEILDIKQRAQTNIGQLQQKMNQRIQMMQKLL